MEFEPKDMPSQEKVLQELEDLFMFIYKRLEVASHIACQYFLQMGETNDPALYPCMFRYHAKKQLSEAAENMQFELRDIENNGLWLIYGQYHIRILKSTKEGGLPPAGTSRIRKWFYCQKALWSLKELAALRQSNGKTQKILNLVLLWDISIKTKMLQLKLACPKYGNVTSAVTYWMQDLQHPAYSIGNEDVASAYPDDDDLDISIGDDDLDISI